MRKEVKMGKRILAGFYLLVWRGWIFLYQHRILPQKRVNCFVVSIGNLTVGGTGKTPFTIFLAQQYKKRGKRVGIVSRGYRGNYKGPVTIVSDGETIFESAETAGDEPVLMAKRLIEGNTLEGSSTPSSCSTTRLGTTPGGVPIVVSRDRFLGCQWLIDHFNVNVILLDDGFQHLRLYRDLNILLIDTTQRHDALLPLGPMREPLSAIQRANAVILTRQEKDPTPSFTMPIGFEFTGPVFQTTFSPAALIHLLKPVARPASDIQAEPILAFCGIGNPNAFLQMLTRLGATIRETLFFRDHYHYTPSDMQTIIRKAHAHSVKSVITTEKDAVKIKHLVTESLVTESLVPGALVPGALVPVALDIWALRIDMTFFNPPSTWEPLFFGNT